MKYSTKTKKNINKFFLILMLHSSFVHPSQSIVGAVYNTFTKKYDNKYIGDGSVTKLIYAANQIKESNPTSSDSFSEKKQINPVESLTKTILKVKDNKLTKIIAINNNLGLIGIDKDHAFDNPTDNYFDLNFDETLEEKNIVLQYDVFGIENSIPAKSINGNIVSGGHAVKINKKWTTISETINTKQLNKGKNTIFFTVPTDNSYAYKIRNLKIISEKTNTSANELFVLNTINNTFLKGIDKIYLNGYFKTNLPNGVKIYANNELISLNNNQFEGFIKYNNEKTIQLKAVYNQQTIANETIVVANTTNYQLSFPVSYDFNTITKSFKPLTATTLNLQNTSIAINEKSLEKGTEISITKIRNIDVSPLDPGFINVTPNKTAFRFLPDGTQFIEDVKISIPYDENLIPKGLDANEIKTYYFDNQARKWIAVEKDSTDLVNKIIISKTNHFTDYINGIIQAPESPQTASFAPNMMNDIKAASPESQMSLIAPPQVSQKGDANISYPIKIPSGRSGMQPQVAIQYSSDAGNGWLGEGWNIATPAITLDTRWGVPTFDGTNESEMYQLNGEQLMYPKLNDTDWMPNRHFDAAAGVYSTQDRIRISNANFTFRKQNNFSKIERLGQNPTNYYWKVTGTDGTISWYGGKTGVVPNAVITNDAGNVVQWSLYMVEDPQKNNIIYEYKKQVLTGQGGANDNLNGGLVYHVDKIFYTGYNNAKGNYNVVFTDDTATRNDVNVDARLGLKVVNPFLLNKIVVNNLEFKIREFKLNYVTGKFGKTLLRNIAEFDNNDKEFYKHEFEYYDDVDTNGTDVYFGNGIVEQTVCNDVKVTNCFISNDILTSYLANNAKVFVNNNLLQGGPFNSMASFVSAMQIQYPNCIFSYSNSGSSFRISITGNSYLAPLSYFYIKIENNIGNYNIGMYNCNSSRTNFDFENHFSNLKNRFTTNYSNPNTLNTNCQTFGNNNFPITGNPNSFTSVGAILGSTTSENINVGGYLGFGVDFSWDVLSKNITIGGSYNHSWDNSESLTSLIDINGDGLDDIVYKHNNNLYWKKHVLTITNQNSQEVKSHNFTPAQPINSINNSINTFYSSFGESSSFNLQANFGLSGSASAFAGWDTSKNKSNTNIYFTDGNGDGLMDIVKYGSVYFNKIDLNGNPYFELESSNTENMLIQAEPANINIPNIDIEVKTSNFDSVKIWEAPKDGKISIENNIVNNEPTKEAIITIERNKKIEISNCVTSNFSGYAPETFTVDFGTVTGQVGINYNAYNFPQKFDITWNGQTYSSGYRGPSSFNNVLIANNVPLSEIQTANPSNAIGQLLFNKTAAMPNTATVTVWSYGEGIQWTVSTICPQLPPQTTQTNAFNTISCKYEPENICLLFGAKLNTTTPIITNVLTTSSCDNTTPNLVVKKGDRIYFRVHASPENKNPKISWNPKISYTENNLSDVIDQNGKKPYSSSYSDYFVLSQNKPVPFPGNGSVSIEWYPRNVTNPNDDIKYEIIKRVKTGNTISDVVLFSKICAANIASVLEPLNLSNISITGNDNNTVTQFLFKATSSSNVKWANFDWKPKIIFKTNQQVSGTTGNLETIEEKYPIVDYSIYKNFTCGNGYNTINVSSYNNGNSLTINPNLNNSIFNSNDNGVLYFVVKKNNSFVGRKKITVTNGFLTISNEIISLGTNSTNIEVGFYTDDSSRTINSPTDVSLLNKLLSLNNIAIINNGTNSFNISTNQVNLSHKIIPQFGHMYGQWGQFFYNPRAATSAVNVPSLGVNLLKEELLTISNSQATALYNSLLANPNQLSNDLTTLQNINTNNPNSGSLIQSTLTNVQNNSGINNMPFVVANSFRDYINGSGPIDRWIGMNVENYIDRFDMRTAKLSQNYNFGNITNTVVQSSIRTGAYGIDKINIGEGENVSAGGGVSGVGLSGTTSLNGNSVQLTDYIDLNGDRYPDLLSNTDQQLTKPTGGLKNTATRGSHQGDISYDYNSSWGLTASGTFGKSGKATPGADGAKRPANNKLKIGKPGISSFGNGNNSLGISGSFGQGDTTTSKVFADINGDGLTDILTKGTNTVSVKLNYGNTNFNTNNNFGSFNLSKSESTTYGGGLGFNYANASIEAGVSLGRTDSDFKSNLIDMNGDGLLDKVSSTNSVIDFNFNLGNKFTNNFGTHNFSLNNSASTTTFGLNATGTYSIIWPLYLLVVVIPLKIPSVSFTASGGNATNRTKKTIQDFDGDGFADLLEEISESQIKVYYSKIKRTNKLKTVNNPLGGNFVLDYAVQKIDYNNPNPVWALTSVKVNTNNPNEGVSANNMPAYYNTFTYENGRYDRREREFYGFEKVISIARNNINTNGTEQFKTSETTFYNNSYFLNGLVKESKVMTNQGLFSTSENTYQIKTTLANGDLNIASNEPLTFDVGGKEGRRQAAVLLTKTTNKLYNFSTTPIVTESEMVYDGKGRVIEYIDNGNIALTTDNYKSTITYHTTLNNNIINIPKNIKVFEGNTLKREREITQVDPNTGQMLEMKALISGTSIANGGVTASTKMEYDVFGNLKKTTYPQNSNGQSMTQTYEYDNLLNKYLVKVTDAFGYSSTASYDYNFDNLLTTTDIAGNVMSYSYDQYGRVIRILAPKEIGTAKKSFTLSFTYNPTYAQLTQNGLATTVPVTSFTPFAITRHYDAQNPTNNIETINFIDGLARSIQVKKDIQINTGTTTSPIYVEKMSVSGKVVYDGFGRAFKQFHPKEEAKLNSTNYVLNNVATDPIANLFSTTEFDSMDRPVKTIDAANNQSTVNYGLENFEGSLKLFTTSVVAQNATVNIQSKVYKDIQGRTLITVNNGPNGDIKTRFNYNAISELKDYTDDEGLSTSYTYDLLGRKLSVTHPDKGTSNYTYDNASNLIELQTANLASTGEAIKYNYDFSRLKTITFPVINGLTNISNVEYNYGAPNTGNNSGRLVYQSDATGKQTFEYGDMGELIANKRTIVAPNLPAREFYTQFTYDSWNRVQNITYPDGENVKYKYDLGGNLFSMQGETNGLISKYIKQIDYDRYEQKTYMKYGNETETKYTYTNDLRRLANLQVKTSAGQALMNNNYTYDKVGNITQLQNLATPTSNQLGGKYEHNYTYDNLNRLTEANGNFDGFNLRKNPQDSNYSLEMQYNNTHGITQKLQNHTYNNEINPTNSYKNNYTYLENTHKVQYITDEQTGENQYFEYDLNGNLTYQKKNSGKNFIWDESNRLRVVLENQKMQHYLYDAAGERTLKASSQAIAVNENGQETTNTTQIQTYTTYANAFLVIDANQQYSKHYYMGTQRFLSKMGTQSINIFGKTDAPSLNGKNKPTDSFNPTALQQQQINSLKNSVKGIYNGTLTFETLEGKTPENTDTQTNNTSKNTSTSTTNKPGVPLGMFYYHPDHLGTGTFLTDGYGNAYQFFVNLPFGETMYEQSSFTEGYNNPYKFNGKELDPETNLYYYGARYYDPSTSIWLGVDPLAEKYPGFNPYNYCMQNPVNLVDPTGMSVEDIRVIDSKGNHLFTLDDGNKAITTITIKQLYENKTQWFEPFANQYMPLKSVEPIVSDSEYRGILHTNFQSIVEWTAKENRYAISFGPTLSGDWKSSSSGGNGYLLSEIDGIPYWTDALGQIPFAIDTYEHYLRNSFGKSNERPDFETVETGADFASGFPYIGADYTVTYDNAMIIRTTEWAVKHMKTYSKKTNTFENHTAGIYLYSDELKNSSTSRQIDKYSEIIHN